MSALYSVCRRGPAILAMAFVAGLVLAPAQAAPKSKASEKANPQISFKEDVYPILQIRCLSCHQPHGAGFEASGLDLRTYQGLMKGTKFGAIVVPGDAFTSNLMVLVDGRASPAIRMPHGKKKLSTCDRDLLRRWINQGAKDN